MNRVDIFGVPYAVTDYAAASELILDKAKAGAAYSVFALPVHGIIEARDDAEFKQAVQTADLIVPDGQPVRWAMNYFHDVGLEDRVYGPKLLAEVLAKADVHKLRVFVYGGSTEEVQTKFVSFIEYNYPNLEVCGVYREDRAAVQTLNADSINSAAPHIVIVGLGCPNQEKWIARHQDQVNAVMIGVGAALSFYSGATKMAPVWMQSLGLEWLFRLLSEPRRLWRRYFYTNSTFILMVLKKMFRAGAEQRG
ncbi:MAG: WecB/TagA/CpsF family glycosyltransferase [Pseudomonadota bacterium]